MSEKHTNDLGPDTVLARADELIEAEIDGDTVMMSIERGEYYGLDTIGSEIWKMLATPLSVAAICETMITRYEVAPEQCQRDVIAFLDDLVSDGSLHIVED